MIEEENQFGGQYREPEYEGQDHESEPEDLYHEQELSEGFEDEEDPDYVLVKLSSRRSPAHPTCLWCWAVKDATAIVQCCLLLMHLFIGCIYNLFVCYPSSS